MRYGFMLQVLVTVFLSVLTVLLFFVATTSVRGQNQDDDHTPSDNFSFDACKCTPSVSCGLKKGTCGSGSFKEGDIVEHGGYYSWYCAGTCQISGCPLQKETSPCTSQKPTCDESKRYGCNDGSPFEKEEEVEKATILIVTEGGELKEVKVDVRYSVWECREGEGEDSDSSDPCSRKIPRKGECGSYDYEEGLGTCAYGGGNDNLGDSDTHYNWPCISPDYPEFTDQYHPVEKVTDICQAPKFGTCGDLADGKGANCGIGIVKGGIREDTYTIKFFCDNEGRKSDECTINKIPHCSDNSVRCYGGTITSVSKERDGLRTTYFCYNKISGDVSKQCTALDTPSLDPSSREGKKGIEAFESISGPACTSFVDALGDIAPEFFSHCVAGDTVLDGRYLKTGCRLGDVFQDDAIFYVRRMGGDFSKPLTVNLTCGHVTITSRDDVGGLISADDFSDREELKEISVDLLQNQDFVSFLAPRHISPGLHLSSNVAMRCTIREVVGGDYVPDTGALTDLVEISGPAFSYSDGEDRPMFANVVKVVMDRYQVPRGGRSGFRISIPKSSVFFTYLWGHYTGFVRMPRYSIQGLLTAPQFSISGGVAEEVWEVQSADLHRYQILSGLFSSEYKSGFSEKHYGFLTPNEAGEEYEKSYEDRFKHNLGTALANFMLKIPDAYR